MLLRGLILLFVIALAQPARARDEDWHLSVFAGQLTFNHFEDVIRPDKLDLADSGLAGVAIGRDWRLADSRWSIGLEAQLVRHFGLQDHWEANLPLILRYHPRRPWPASLDSFAFGIGPSYATDLPEVEIRNDGATRHSLIYWMIDARFDLPQAGDQLFLRLHHRSDAFGLLQPEAGSNAIVLGYRWSF